MRVSLKKVKGTDGANMFGILVAPKLVIGKMEIAFVVLRKILRITTFTKAGNYQKKRVPLNTQMLF